MEVRPLFDVMPSFRWGDAASVPSAGVTLFQTDLAFLPV